MNMESMPIINPEDIERPWTSRAKSFIGKIDRKIDEILKYSPDGNNHSLYLDSLKAKIEEIFPIYENKNMTAAKAEEDLKYRLEQDDISPDEQKMLKDILALIQVRTPSFN